MKKQNLYLLLMLLLLLVPYTATHAQKQDFYTSATQLLQGHVQQGQVNYRSLRQSEAELQQLVKQIGGYTLKEASASEKKAFYINAYNLLVLHQVLKHYPLKSVMDVEGFFDRQEFVVAGESMTLNELEKQKLLANYPDARIHFALVCAAKSCPPLLNKAYTPAEVEQQLQQQAVNTLRHNDFIRVQSKEQRVLVSEIFKWYQNDFLKEKPSVKAYINSFRLRPIPASYKLGYYTYNWQLNEAGQQ